MQRLCFMYLYVAFKQLLLPTAKSDETVLNSFGKLTQSNTQILLSYIRYETVPYPICMEILSVD